MIARIYVAISLATFVVAFRMMLRNLRSVWASKHCSGCGEDHQHPLALRLFLTVVVALFYLLRSATWPLALPVEAVWIYFHPELLGPPGN